MTRTIQSNEIFITDTEGVLCDVRTIFLHEYMNMSVVPRHLSRKFYTGSWIHTPSIMDSHSRQETHNHNQHSTFLKVQQHSCSDCNFCWSIFLKEFKRNLKGIRVLVIDGVIICCKFLLTQNLYYLALRYPLFVGSLATKKKKNLEVKIQWFNRNPILFLLENSNFLCVQFYEESRRKNEVCCTRVFFTS